MAVTAQHTVRRALISALFAVGMFAAAGCENSEVTGKVVTHQRTLLCTGKPLWCRPQYRLDVASSGGSEQETVTLGRTQWRRCPVGSSYPACLSGARAAR